MLNLNVLNEFSTLKAVVLGVAKSNGPTPTPEACYDPSSLKHVLQGTYPSEKDMVEEMSALVQIFESHGVKVYRPNIIENCNQIFARDIAFVIEDKLIKSNILPDRAEEFSALDQIVRQIDSQKCIELPEECHVEGGDVIIHNDYIFVGVYLGDDYSSFSTARTNIQAVEALRSLFPNKKVKALELKKSNTNPLEGALHLDCCFQPLGRGKALLHREGFTNQEDFIFLEKLFGKEHIYLTTKQEMANMNCNVFSISNDVVISEAGFTRLNKWLELHKFKVEKVSYSEISKQGGLLRCSTLPLIRL